MNCNYILQPHVAVSGIAIIERQAEHKLIAPIVTPDERSLGANLFTHQDFLRRVQSLDVLQRLGKLQRPGKLHDLGFELIRRSSGR